MPPRSVDSAVGSAVGSGGGLCPWLQLLLSEDVLSEEAAPLWPQAANTVMHSSMASKTAVIFFI